ncbi:MAG TPA: polysaccharide biosynthesis protein, partial [Bryobacteraceae bacterium]
IRLSGYEPDVDLEIRFTGTRPGEKLFEELVLDGEQMLPTYHEKIRIFQGARLDAEGMERWLEDVERAVAREDEIGLLRRMKELVPEYQPVGNWHDILGPGRLESAAAS